MVILVAGLGFGDEGKGSLVNWLTHTAEHGVGFVVRYNGGAQAGHNVVTAQGRHHTFSQFGSGSFAGAKTYLSRFMLVNPLTLDKEAQALGDWAYKSIFIDREALVTNSYQVITNRIKEIARGNARHGSCGLGIGETVADSLEDGEMSLRFGDLQDREVIRRKLKFSRDKKLEQTKDLYAPDAYEEAMALRDQDFLDVLVDRLAAIASKPKTVDRNFLGSILEGPEDVIFEGAQGVLLDQDYGFQPYTTWSDTTFGNADKLLKEARYDGPVIRQGVLRAYMTRHGAGPLPTEIEDPEIKDDLHNAYGPYQGVFRLGHFDAVLARYALEVIGHLDRLCLTNLDKLPRYPKICRMYSRSDELIASIQPVGTWAEQEKLTHLLTSVAPLYEAVPNPAALVERIQDLLRISIPTCSIGPGDMIPTSLLLKSKRWTY